VATDSVTIDQETAQTVARVLMGIRETLSQVTTVEDWGPIATKKDANLFLLRCLLDYQIKSTLAWKNGKRLVQYFGDPDDIWEKITACSEEAWNAQLKELHLHRFPSAHARLWTIGKRMRRYYEGDARNIWNNRDADEVRERLVDIGAGEQLSRMIVGALRDMHFLAGFGDVKADIHVCRVFGRLVTGKKIQADAATELARQINPSDPWQLDWPLWDMGTSVCRPKNPRCHECKAVEICLYAKENPSGAKAHVC
jgi:endonuclease III